MRLIKSLDYVRLRWKNGGGAMADIVARPEGAGLDAFDWRVSAARIEADGPFSTFADIDRTMVILGGSGLRLDVEGCSPIVLGRESEPYGFPGDAATTAVLTAGPIENLNAMSRRGRFEHRMWRDVVARSRTLVPGAGGVVIVYVEEGAVFDGADGVAPIAVTGDTIVVEGETTLVPQLVSQCCFIAFNRVVAD